jgi:hypothetical protein
MREDVPTGHLECGCAADEDLPGWAGVDAAGGVITSGVDEHAWRHTGFGDKYKQWLAERPKAWSAGIEVVAKDGFTGFKTARPKSSLTRSR